MSVDTRILSKVLYSVDLRVILLKFKAIFCDIFLFATIVASSLVFRIIIRVINVSQEQSKSFIVSIVIDKLILLFETIFRSFNATIKLYAIVNSQIEIEISIILSFVFEIEF